MTIPEEDRKKLQQNLTMALLLINDVARYQASGQIEPRRGAERDLWFEFVRIGYRLCDKAENWLRERGFHKELSELERYQQKKAHYWQKERVSSEKDHGWNVANRQGAERAIDHYHSEIGRRVVLVYLTDLTDLIEVPIVD